MDSALCPHEAEIVARTQESNSIFTIWLRLTDPTEQAVYHFQPGQFNMVYLYGVGEVAISIVSDPADAKRFAHTIRIVGRVTRGLAALEVGQYVGVRGPFGRGWPLESAHGHDVMVVTGGLGCAPVVSVIDHLTKYRSLFGHLTIIQGVKHAEDLIWREHYERWREVPDTSVHLAADHGGRSWPWHVGLVTELISEARLDPQRTVTMMCGPEGMMRASVNELRRRGLPEDRIHISMERNMQCAVGHCGHCQFGGKFICRQGPVFPYTEIKELFGVSGF